MLGKLEPQHREVTIVGAGIAGLLLAERLDRAGWVVTLVEASPRTGGLLATTDSPRGIAEAAAHSLLVTPPVRGLFARLGVELVPIRADSRARFIWRGGQLRKFPLSLGEVIRAFARAYFVLSDKKVDPERQTLEAWGRRHLGEAAVKYLLTPFVRGIYGCQPSELLVGVAFPALIVDPGHSLVSSMVKSWHRKLRGLDGGRTHKARSRMMAPRGGMSELVSALESHLRSRLGVRFKSDTPLSALPAECRNIALCVPAPEAARLLSKADPILSDALREVSYTPLVTITAFVEKRSFPKPPLGVGVLLPEGTSRRTLGVLFNSSSFPGRVADPANWVSLTLIMGGSTRPNQGAASDDELTRLVRSDLEALFDLAPGARIETVIRRWPQAVPKYDRALSRAWDAARAGWCARSGHVLFGNYTGQVSIRGLIESIDQLS